jgi:hypothetical protein
MVQGIRTAIPERSITMKILVMGMLLFSTFRGRGESAVQLRAVYVFIFSERVTNMGIQCIEDTSYSTKGDAIKSAPISLNTLSFALTSSE